VFENVERGTALYTDEADVYSDAERFVIVLARTIHRRLTYDELTGRLDTPLAQA